MREHPILFSGPMVRAILLGQKTVTRRIVTPQPSAGGRPAGPGPWWSWEHDAGAHCTESRRCPYGATGDRLWVRETWNVGKWVSGDGYRVWFEPTPTIPKVRPPDVEIEYASDDSIPAMADDPPIFRPNIHMPRWASRITLTVESVRAERLHAIDEADAVAEGVESYHHGGYDHEIDATQPARTNFRRLWDGINGKRAPWASNPWVWRVQFRRETP